MERKALGMVSSSAVLVLTVFTIAVFIIYGYSILFYAVLAAALALALFNAWLIAGMEARRGMPGRKRAGARRR